MILYQLGITMEFAGNGEFYLEFVCFSVFPNYQNISPERILTCLVDVR